MPRTAYRCERIRAGTPALAEPEDAYTNHIHADDLARIVLAALTRGRAGRAYNAADGSWLKMGDYFDLVAERFGLPPPPRVSRAGGGASGCPRPCCRSCASRAAWTTRACGRSCACGCVTPRLRQGLAAAREAAGTTRRRP